MASAVLSGAGTAGADDAHGVSVAHQRLDGLLQAIHGLIASRLPLAWIRYVLQIPLVALYAYDAQIFEQLKTAGEGDGI